MASQQQSSAVGQVSSRCGSARTGRINTTVCGSARTDRLNATGCGSEGRQVGKAETKEVPRIQTPMLYVSTITSLG